MSDYPTCSTCDHFERRTVWDEDEGLYHCEREIAYPYNHGVPEDFGCILHSDLEDDEKEYDATGVDTRSPSQQDTYTV